MADTDSNIYGITRWVVVAYKTETNVALIESDIFTVTDVQIIFHT